MPRILCVDDEQINLEIYEAIFQDSFEVICADSGEACLQILNEAQPDIIIMDVMMPGMSGLECCQAIKKETDFHAVPIVFISAKNDLRDRLEGYLSGGDDYVAKPFDNDELMAKIKALLGHREQIVAATNEAKEAMAATMSILTTMGETNAVVAFLQQTFSCNDYQQLADKIIQTHAEWGLEIAIEMTIDDRHQYFYTGDASLAVEEAAFDYIRDKGRLVDHGSRTAVNYPRISILIRNMPLHDMEFYGRIKDYIAIIAQGADSKIITLIAAEKLAEQQDKLVSIMERTEKTLKQLDSDYKEQQQLSQNILTTIGAKVEESFLNLGLTGEQEDFLTSVIHEAEEQTAQLFDAGLDLDQKFGSIMSDINEALATAEIDTNVIVEDETADDAVAFF